MSSELRGLLVLLAAVLVVRVAVVVSRRARGESRPAVGVNVVGYFGSTGGLGERARELVACLDAAGVPTTTWDLTSTGDATLITRRTTIAVVTAVQLAAARERCPEPFEHAERTIGYFFWELAEVADDQHWGIGLVDEIWAPTRFVRDAYAAATDRPVRLVPIPVPPPAIGENVMPAVGKGPGDRPFTFLTSFDHRSVMERKNPVSVVEAFRRAFPNGDEPVALVVKTLHGAERPDAVRRLDAAIGDDDRIRIRDEVLPEAEHMALLGSADAFVSLHRSEGLGLHLAEAMWLGTPVVATRYSGNLDLMDDACAALVDADLVPVADGDGAYPESAHWADPDVGQAAAAMRRLVADPEWGRGLADAARARMESQPSRSETGRALAGLLGLD